MLLRDAMPPSLHAGKPRKGFPYLPSAACRGLGGGLLRSSRLRHILRGFFTGGIAEIPEEIGIRPQDEPRVIGAQSSLIGLHGAVEREEIGVLAEGFGEDSVAFGVALAANLLGARLRLRHYDGHVTVSLGADLLALLVALAANGRSLTLAFGLHALIDRLAVLLRKISAPDAHVDNLDAKGARFAIELIAHPRHQRGAVVAHHVD